MNSSLAAIALLIVSLVLANLPFLSEGRFLVFQRGVADKGVGFRFFELLVYFGLALGAGILLESSLGPIYPQRWEFYGITSLFFVVLAAPGFVYRYLYRRGS